MKNHFASHIKTDFNGDNNQNILFEMMAICISDGTRKGDFQEIYIETY